MFNTLYKSLIMLTILILALGAAFASTSALGTGTTLAASPTTQPIGVVTATPAAQTHRLAALNNQKTRVAAATTSGTMLWALDTGKVLVTFDTQNRAVTDLAFTPDGLWLAASLNDGSVAVWAVP